MKNQNDLSIKYHRATRLIHWLTAILLIITFAIGKYMVNIPIVEKLDTVKLHIVLGTSILVLTLVRVWLFFKKTRPPRIKTGSAINDALIVFVHNAFYFLLISIALAGFATSLTGGYWDAINASNPNLVKAKSEISALVIHGVLSFITIVFVIVHIVGVARHRRRTNENTLKRMI